MTIAIAVVAGVVVGIIISLIWACICGGPDISDAEIETWLDWREELAMRRGVARKLREMGAEEMEMVKIKEKI